MARIPQAAAIKRRRICKPYHTKTKFFRVSCLKSIPFLQREEHITLCFLALGICSTISQTGFPIFLNTYSFFFFFVESFLGWTSQPAALGFRIETFFSPLLYLAIETGWVEQPFICPGLHQLCALIYEAVSLIITNTPEIMFLDSSSMQSP